MPEYAIQILTLLCCAYAVGTVTFGYYLVLFATGKDLRTIGSGSVGARNTGRVLGRWGFAAALAGDLGKAAALVCYAKAAMDMPAAAAGAAAVVLGHIYPLQLRLHGGKGVAPAIGALAVLDWQLTAGLGCLILLLAAALRSLTLSTLSVFVISPLAALLSGRDPALAPALLCIALLVVRAHSTNIKAEFDRPRTGREKTLTGAGQ